MGAFAKKHLSFTTKVPCAVNCRMCPQKGFFERYSKRSNIYEMSLALFKSYIDKVPKTTIIRFSGFCENFLNKSCIDMIDYTFNSGFRMALYSTFEGASLDIVKSLVKYLPFEFGVHVADQDGHSKITIDDEYYKKIEFIAINFPEASYMSHSVAVEPGVYKILTKYNKKWYSSLVGDDRAGFLRPTNVYKRGKIICGGKSNYMAPLTKCLMPNGDIVLCTQDYGLENILGNLSSEKYEDITSMDNPVYREILRKMNTEDEYVLCRKCVHAEIIK